MSDHVTLISDLEKRKRQQDIQKVRIFESVVWSTPNLSHSELMGVKLPTLFWAHVFILRSMDPMGIVLVRMLKSMVYTESM